MSLELTLISCHDHTADSPYSFALYQIQVKFLPIMKLIERHFDVASILAFFATENHEKCVALEKISHIGVSKLKILLHPLQRVLTLQQSKRMTSHISTDKLI